MRLIYFYYFIIFTSLFSGVISSDVSSVYETDVDERCVESVYADMILYSKSEWLCPMLCQLKRLFISKYCTTTGNSERDKCYRANQRCMWDSKNACHDCVVNVFADMYNVSEYKDFGLDYKEEEAMFIEESFGFYDICYCPSEKEKDPIEDVSFFIDKLEGVAEK
ncbi:hypothetical protein BCR32DRAFT_299464 [Anaeromyces robustus]|uniref:Saposin B-type domain-containing protein n=1 Tax=Anaeromyces robustus TaxID=1754192 RepID=A0A1Y1XNM8_9FUNG|nr:hypothetical protein BCR32DRAFT_299464 [Anaeromyces robustus]|eukprot:ORX87116.1 hypothetical protein BCR32DRAFT_299464 [Anaeromyces robustus]